MSLIFCALREPSGSRLERVLTIQRIKIMRTDKKTPFGFNQRASTLNVLVVLLLSFFAPSIQASQQQELPIEHFTELPKFSSLKISPNGDYLSVSVKVGQESQVVVLDRKTMRPIHRHRFQQEKASVAGHWWVSDKRMVFGLETFVPTMQEAPLRNVMLYGVDFDGKREDVLASPLCKKCDLWGAELLDPLVDEKKYALVLSYTRSGTRQKVARMNLRNGSISKAVSVPPRTIDIVLDKSKQPRYAVSGNDAGDRLVHYREPGKVEWTLLAQYPYPGGWMFPVGFSADESRALVLDSRDGGTQAVGFADLRLQSVEHLFRDSVTDITGYDIDENDQLYAASAGIGKPRRVILNPEHPQAQTLQRLEASFPDDAVSITSSTQDGSLHLVGTRSEKNPGTYYLYDESAGELTYLLARMPWIKSQQGFTTTDFIFEARDGLKITGLLTMPKAQGDERVPLVVMPHGGPHGPYDRWGWDSHVQFLASRGYAVVQVNFRGSGSHGADFEKAGFREWGRKIQFDIIDGARYVIANNPIDAERVGIMGGSFGGYSALQSAILEPDFFKASIGVVGVYDFNLMYTNGDIRGRRSGRKYLEKALGRDKAQFQEYSPLARAHELKAPVLLIQGEKDQRAPVVHADKLAQRLEELNHEFEYIIMPNEGHGFYKPENRQRYFRSVEQFLAQHL